MLKSIVFGAGLLVAGMGMAHAAPLVVPMQAGASSITLVGEGCGANRWRDRNGVCHRFGGPGGVARGTRFECPPGMHIGEGGGRCWPDR